MSTPPKAELIKGFIEEVKSYIPSLTGGLESLRKSPEKNEVLEETHRLVHTIKGASSMVGLAGLSQIAGQMEEFLDEILAGRQDFTEESFNTMNGTIELFREYCRKYLNGGVASRSMLAKATTAFRQARGLPPAADEQTHNDLLESVPEYEGFNLQKDIESGQSSQINVEESSASPEMTGQAKDRKNQIETAPEDDDSPLNARAENIAAQSAQINSPARSQELLESFYEEAEEHLEDLGRSLYTLESQVRETVTISPDLREEIRRIRRSVHTLKGAAAVIGFQKFSTHAHRLEDLLDWLYEESQELSPQILKVLTESSDLLDRIIANPKATDTPEAESLRKQYQAILKTGSAAQKTAASPSRFDSRFDEDAAATVDLPTGAAADDITDIINAEEKLPAESIEDLNPRFTRTLRVDMTRIDELVNLAGETFIALSAFDQKMEFFLEAVNNLELSRARLIKIARDLEVSYEVKALEQLKSLPFLSALNADNRLQAEQFVEFDSLELDRYSELNRIIRTLNESAVDVGAIHNQLSHLHSDFDGHLTRQRVVLSELQEKIMQVRMTPMSIITNKLRRTVREVSANLGKKVKLVISGENIELDRLIWEKITDPLMHLLRNAIDHGIESNDHRQAHGKPDPATVRLDAAREGNQVVIRIADDGAGLDFKNIRSTAQRMQLSDSVTEMTEDELARFIFYPGFSTSRKISEVSGRGVGMDVVKKNIQDLKGVITVASQKGQGAEFTIRIPLTLAAVRALLFTVGGHTYAIALSEITQILRLKTESILGPQRDILKLDDEVLPLYHMAELLPTGVSESNSDSNLKNLLALVLETGSGRAALVIDNLVGQREIVIKSLGSHLRRVRGISGATILGDGSVVPIINVEEFLRADTPIQNEAHTDRDRIIEKPLEIMVVDDSVSIRKVVSRLLEDQGWKVQSAIDGMDALEKLRNCRPDLIVLDIEMPRINGFEFLGTIRSQADYETIPVVMLTSRTTSKHREKAFALGAKGFVAKPFNNEEFVHLILSLTDGSATQATEPLQDRNQN